MPDATKFNGSFGFNSRPKSIWGCKCIVLITVVITSLGTTLFLIFLATSFIRNLTTPHQGLYQNAAFDDVVNPGEIIQPLIDHEQMFDIAATVWLRTAERESKGNTIIERKGKSILTKNEIRHEIPLYSDIVFQGLKLTDKSKFSVINFTLPTSIFRNTNLTNYDLRASIVLLPTSPTLLDNIIDYSSWIPDYIDTFPVRSWPFPLTSSTYRERNITDRALESFGVTTPLLQFHRIRSRCRNGESEDEKTDYDNLENENISAEANPLELTEGRPVLSAHPYVITRTQIRVVDETKVFNKNTYSRVHRHLKTVSCGQGTLLGPNKYACNRSYPKVGHLETLLQLAVRNESTEEVQTAWAYSPYISISRHPAGPQDLLPIPVNREECPEAIDAHSLDKEKDSINVTWKLSFSGRTYKKLLLVDIFDSPQLYDPSQSDHHRVLAQDQSELSHGIVGHRFSEDAHPRRRLLLNGLQFLFALLVVVFDIRYWLHRSTVSISLMGTALRSISGIFQELATVISEGMAKEDALVDWIISMLFVAPMLVPGFLMIKTITHIKFGWWKGTRWVPVMHRKSATHAERTSQRLDAQTSWHVKLGLFLSVLVTYYFLPLHHYQVLPPLLPEPITGDYLPNRLNDLWPFIVYPMDVTGKILQLHLSWKTQTFAGSSRLFAFCILAMRGVGLAEFTPQLVGKFQARPALVAHALVDFVLLLVAAIQASTLPVVKQNIEHIE